VEDISYLKFIFNKDALNKGWTYVVNIGLVPS
jgi:hypothetical protein